MYIYFPKLRKLILKKLGSKLKMERASLTGKLINLLMKVKEIVWSKRALIERLEILEYWINRNKSSRFSEDNLFLQKIELLSLHPFIGKRTSFEKIRIK